MGRGIEIEWEHSEAELRELYHTEKDVKRRSRYHALWLVRNGRSAQEVSDILDVHYRTLRRWLYWYRDGGLAEVEHRLVGQAGGGEAYLSEVQEEQLRAKADAGHFHTARDIQKWIYDQWQIEYTHKGIYGLLARLDIVWKVPRPANPKADKSQQDDWKKGGCLPNSKTAS